MAMLTINQILTIILPYQDHPALVFYDNAFHIRFAHMTHSAHTNEVKHSEALDLASKVAGRYGRLALTRAAGEAAAAERKGDVEGRDRWASVVAYLRESIQQQNQIAATA